MVVVEPKVHKTHRRCHHRRAATPLLLWLLASHRRGRHNIIVCCSFVREAARRGVTGCRVRVWWCTQMWDGMEPVRPRVDLPGDRLRAGTCVGCGGWKQLAITLRMMMIDDVISKDVPRG